MAVVNERDSSSTTVCLCLALELIKVKKYIRSMTASTVLYLCKSEIRLKMEYYCHVWAGVGQSPLSSLDRIQFAIVYMTLLMMTFSTRWATFFSSDSSLICSSDSPFYIHGVETLILPRILSVKRNLQPGTFLPQNCYFLKQTPRWMLVRMQRFLPIQIKNKSFATPFSYFHVIHIIQWHFNLSRP